MILSDVNRYLRDRGRANTSDIALHFGIAPTAVEGMLQTLQERGRVRGPACTDFALWHVLLQLFQQCLRLADVGSGQEALTGKRSRILRGFARCSGTAPPGKDTPGTETRGEQALRFPNRGFSAQAKGGTCVSPFLHNGPGCSPASDRGEW